MTNEHGAPPVGPTEGVGNASFEGRRISGWAVASLALGVLTIAGGAFFVIPAILAVVFGVIAFRSTSATTGRHKGRWMAITGLVLGSMGLVGTGLFWARMMSY